MLPYIQLLNLEHIEEQSQSQVLVEVPQEFQLRMSDILKQHTDILLMYKEPPCPMSSFSLQA